MCNGDYVKNKIHVIYGTNPKEMVLELLAETDPLKDLRRDALIALKPNLVVAKPASSGATTHPEITAGVIEYLKEKKFSRIVIMEGSWVGDRTERAFRICGYNKLAEQYGIEIIDLQKDGAHEYTHDGFKIKVCDRAMKADYIINLPVMKGHCQTQMTCALKNLKGCIPDTEKSRFHTIGLHKPIAYLNAVLKQNLVIVDAMNGDLSFEEGGNPVAMNRIFSGTDPVQIDAYAARLMGIELPEVPYIGIAENLGIGSTVIDNDSIVELNAPGRMNPRRSCRVRDLAKSVTEKDACSACYANLIAALNILEKEKLLERLNRNIHIGQGFRGTAADAAGIGDCTNKHLSFVPGCPPDTDSIVSFLKNIL